ncbi:PAS domain-containing protein [Noviherbaspirillum sp. CPCC 100848]|uniref:PAS domain-containing protein n=1 Tax=Noviherbaspirillum album TaxID=3080276 RepID=A0ABU6JJM4_9BURK|nr:PAS domain-containing protein [Noviherbaspirillum sp. CPCC 100848]MEC4723859.1 PAS domain-containing protein [Noviherbaspirillum sp. CPCC 100848]
MRKNLPVNDSEYVLQDDRPIVSKTDLKGRITYINPYFVEVSGFDEDELMGAPHNIVRHPDMPEAAFGDLWQTLKAGEIWSAPVKNRRKDGGYYWVIAHVTPITEGGRIVGYMSVRTKPTRQQIHAAIAAYAEINKGSQSTMTLAQGRLVRKSTLSALLRGGRLSMRVRIALASLPQVVVAAFALLHLLLTTTAMPEWLSYAAVVGGMLNIVLYAYLDRGVVRPMGDATDLAKSLAGGDLTQRALPQCDGEGGRLLRALGQMQVNLLAAIGDIRENVTTINQATSEIAAGNANLSARTETQAASLEETASSMEQFAATV